MIPVIPKKNHSICCVPGCEDKLSSRHRIPLKPKILYNSWLERIGNDKLYALSSTEVNAKFRVCSRHFSDACKIIDSKRLKDMSLPTKYLPGWPEDSQLEDFLTSDSAYSFSDESSISLNDISSDCMLTCKDELTFTEIGLEPVHIMNNKVSGGMDKMGWGTKTGEFQDISLEQSEMYFHYVHACHCMVYAQGSSQIIKQYTPKATVLMQMRFDGHLGFPGGVVDSEENVIQALEREMNEEMGSPGATGWQITWNDRLSTQISQEKKLVLHFFAKLVDLATLAQIEMAALQAKDFGSEVMGVVRVPLYTMEDGYRGFPAFLSNNFIGNAKTQLISGLLCKGIMGESEISDALNAKVRYI